MTEYWVSQGNKWCDFCKIYLSNNPASIRNHELGQKHKDNVSKRLASMKQDNDRKKKDEQAAAVAIQQIEQKAQRSYQKDVAKLEETRKCNAQQHVLSTQLLDNQEKWDYDSTSGYYNNPTNGLFYDPNSGFYYSDAIGKWVTQEEAYAAIKVSSGSKSTESIIKNLTSTSEASKKSKNGTLPGKLVSTSLNPMRPVKGTPSSLNVGKRKRQDEKPKVLSPEDAAALKAREAARKRVEKREKPLLGLYKPSR
ncbi:hypothetical protein ACFE04_021729 [Oxalis oulophora]